MLKKIVINNFGPAKNEVVLSMEKGKTEQFPENLIEGTNLLKNIYIYGANNSGKSKVVDSIMLLKDIINIGAEIFNKGYYPYAFDHESFSHEFKIDYFIILNNNEYIYSIKLNRFERKIIEETLKIDDKTIFLRIDDKVEFRDVIQFVEKDIFFLTYYSTHIKEIEKVNNLISYIKGIMFIDQQRESYSNIKSSSVLNTKKIEYLEKNLDEMNNLVKDFGFDFELTVLENTHTVERSKVIGVKKFGGELFLASLESFGTNVFIDLLLEIEQSKNSSQLIVIDEIERGIHFALVAGFIKYINERYPKKQLILPTHMTDLLECDDLNIRKDQVYIARITQEKGLELKKEFNKKVIRETMNFQKILKSKAVGGIPEIKDFGAK